MGQRNDRVQYHSGLDSYSYQGAGQRAQLDSYYSLNRPFVDTYRDHYMDNSQSFNALYVSQQAGMAQFATERNLYNTSAQQV